MGSLAEVLLERDDVAKAFVLNLKAEAAKYKAEEKHWEAEARRSHLLADSVGFDVERSVVVTFTADRRWAT